jgi:hypothetical protein
LARITERLYECSKPDAETLERSYITPERQQQALSMARQRSEAYAAKLIIAIDSRDLQSLENWLHGGNKTTRNIFEQETGVSLGHTNASGTAAIRNWAGPAVFDKYRADRHAAYVAREQVAVELTRQEKVATALKKSYRYALGGAGIVRVVTAKQMIDDLIVRGFTRLEDSKRGAFPILHLYNADNWFHTLRGKHEMEYARQRVANLQQKAA